MNFVYTFHFVSALVLFGLMVYIFQPVLNFLQGEFPPSADLAPYSAAMFFLWAILPAINLFFSGIRLVMAYQRRV